jgi:hypothetical protein
LGLGLGWAWAVGFWRTCHGNFGKNVGKSEMNRMNIEIFTRFFFDSRWRSKHLKAANWDFSPVKHHRIELTGMGNSPKNECSNQSIGIF